MPRQPDRVTARRKVSPAFDMFQTAKYGMEKVEAAPEGSFHELLTAVLMSALAFEAVLNEAGVHIWGSDSSRWRVVEKASPMDKFAAIAEEAGYEFDRSSRPVQTVVRLMKIRNDIVHGKPQEFTATVSRRVTKENPSLRRVRDLSPTWEQACTPEFARRCIEDVGLLSDSLSEYLDMTSPLRFGGLSVWG